MTTFQEHTRSLRVEINHTNNETLIIQNLYTEFNLNLSNQPNPPESELKIYNLGHESTNKIIRHGDLVKVFAGYGNIDLRQIYHGEVRRVTQGIERNDHITTLTLGASDRARTNTFLSTAFLNTRLDKAAREIVRMMGLTSRNSLIMDDHTIESFVWSGSASRALDDLVSRYGFQWYENLGTIYFKRDRESIDLPIPIVSDRAEGSNIGVMIGNPLLTERGIRVKTRIDFDIQIDQQIRLNTRLFDAEPEEYPSISDYKVTSISYGRDNQTGEFAATLECITLQEDATSQLPTGRYMTDAEFSAVTGTPGFGQPGVADQFTPDEFVPTPEELEATLENLGESSNF